MSYLWARFSFQAPSQLDSVSLRTDRAARNGVEKRHCAPVHEHAEAQKVDIPRHDHAGELEKRHDGGTGREHHDDDLVLGQGIRLEDAPRRSSDSHCQIPDDALLGAWVPPLTLPRFHPPIERSSTPGADEDKVARRVHDSGPGETSRDRAVAAKGGHSKGRDHFGNAAERVEAL